jgi:bacillithiol system protein YtxJ
MFRWLTKRRNEAGAGEAAKPILWLEELRNQEIAVVFKHSRSCPVSWAARNQVDRFAANHSCVPVYTVTVQEERGLSGRIAEQTGIRHESPQVIVFHRGAVVAHASHGEVTADYLDGFVKGGV